MNKIASKAQNTKNSCETDSQVCCCISVLMSWFHTTDVATLDDFIEIIEYPSIGFSSNDVAALKFALTNPCDPPLADSRKPPSPEVHEFRKMLAEATVALEKKAAQIDSTTIHYLQFSANISSLVWQNITNWGTLIFNFYHHNYISVIDVDWLENILDVSKCLEGIKIVKEYKENIKMTSLATNIRWVACPNSMQNGFVQTTTCNKPRDARCWHIDIAKKVTAQLLNCKVTDLLPHSATVGSVSYNWKVSLEFCKKLKLPNSISPALQQKCDEAKITKITIVVGRRSNTVLINQLVLVKGW